MSVQAVIIGANGFLGRRLSETLSRRRNVRLSDSEKLPLSRIVLFDNNDTDGFLREHCGKDSRCAVFLGSLTRADDVTEALRPRCDDVTAVITFHLAAVLSGNAEANFDAGMEVNLHGAINVIQRVRELKTRLGNRPQVYVYASTDYVACFNATNRSVPVGEEAFRLSPTSYGVHKACVELLVCDFSRHGFIDGRVARISAVIGRPGFSNSVSSSYSMIFTQTLLGKDYTVYPDMDYPYPCSSIDNNCRCMIRLASPGKVPGQALGHNRVLQLPARSFTLRNIWTATQKVASEMCIQLGNITQSSLKESPFAFKEMNVVPAVDHSRALSLGLPDGVDLEAIIRDYAHRYVLDGGKSATDKSK